MENQQKAEVMTTRGDAKLSIIHSLSKPGVVPMMVIWYDQQLGWQSVYDNDLKNNKVPREAVAKMLFDIVATLKLFEQITTKVD